MDPLIVVTYPDPVFLEARPIDHDAVPEGNVGVAYYYNDALIARSAVAPESLEAIRNLLAVPVSVALAASLDTQGNIEGRICLALPVDGNEMADSEEEEAEPWKASVPAPPTEIGLEYDEEEPEFEATRVVLLPIGHVVRGAHDRKHADDVAGDAQEMLDNLLSGRARDAVAKAIDDLLRSI